MWALIREISNLSLTPSFSLYLSSLLQRAATLSVHRSSMVVYAFFSKFNWLSLLWEIVFGCKTAKINKFWQNHWRPDRVLVTPKNTTPDCTSFLSFRHTRKEDQQIGSKHGGCNNKFWDFTVRIWLPVQQFYTMYFSFFQARNNSRVCIFSSGICRLFKIKGDELKLSLFFEWTWQWLKMASCC